MELDLTTFLTPHKIVLANLVRLYAQRHEELGFELALYLVEEVKSSAQYFDKTLDEVLNNVEDFGEGGEEIAQALEQEIRDMDSPDDLFIFLQEGLQEASGPGCTIERNSTLDVFIRKVLLSFRMMPFDRFCGLFGRLKAYLDALGADEGDSSAPEHASPLSVGDLQAHVQRQARRLEETAEPLDLEAVGDDIERMMGLANKVPKVLYLRFLHAMHSRDFQQALDNLHHYFDIATGGVSVQYAVLNLAVLHLHFGHLDEALHAINETVRVAQQSNDSTALAFAVSWLLRTVQAQNNVRVAHSPTSHDVREEQRLLRRCFSCASEEEIPHLACLTGALLLLYTHAACAVLLRSFVFVCDQLWPVVAMFWQWVCPTQRCWVRLLLAAMHGYALRCVRDRFKEGGRRCSNGPAAGDGMGLSVGCPATCPTCADRAARGRLFSWQHG
jgi:hypothetical protein